MEAPPRSGIILIVVFLGTFALLMNAMPSEFITAGEDTDYIERFTPEADLWDPDELQEFAVGHDFNITPGIWGYAWGRDWPRGEETDEGFEHDFWFQANTVTGYWIENEHTHPFWILYRWDNHRMKFKNVNHTDRGEALFASELELDMELKEGGLRSAEYQNYCAHLNLKVRFGYNSTIYGANETGIRDAWDNNELMASYVIDAENIAKSHVMSGFSLITMILFYQNPQVHFLVNSIIALPMWVGIAIIIYQIIISIVKALPFT